MHYPKVKTKNVLITGCSSGIGLASARVLREAGWRVIPTARKQEDLQRLRTEGFTPVELELTRSSSIQQASSHCLELGEGRLGALVNNAGFGQPGAVEDLSREAMREQFEVNVLGMQELTNSLIPALRDQGWGRIVNVSSVVGRICLPFLGIYSASKFAMEALSDALRIELRGTGISVSVVEPGPIESEFRRHALEKGDTNLHGKSSPFSTLYQKEMKHRLSRKDPERRFMLPPEAVARKIVHALESPRPKTRYPVTLPAYAVEFLRRFAPDRWVDALMSSQWKSKGEK